MNKQYGSQSMVADLQIVVVRRPDAAFGAADPETWHYAARPFLPAAQQEHDDFTRRLRDAGCEVIYHAAPLPDHLSLIHISEPTRPY